MSERDADILNIRQTYAYTTHKNGVWRLAGLTVAARDERDAARAELNALKSRCIGQALVGIVDFDVLNEQIATGLEMESSRDAATARVSSLEAEVARLKQAGQLVVAFWDEWTDRHPVDMHGAIMLLKQAIGTPPDGIT